MGVISQRHYLKVNSYIKSVSSLQVIDRLNLDTEPASDGGTWRTTFFRNTTVGQRSLENVWATR